MRKVVIDTDCGVDDCCAIVLTIASKRAKLIGITCVDGNTSVDSVCNNVGRLLEWCGREDIPFYRGAEHNLLSIPIGRYAGNGTDGFGDPDIPATKLKPASDRHAALELIDLAKKYGKELDIMTIGPLTNLAIAVTLEPKFFEMIGNVYMMIGSETCLGNTTPMGEFNSVYDAEAAKIVFNHVHNANIISWNLTINNLVNWDVYHKLIKLNTFGELIGLTYKRLNDEMKKEGNFTGWCIPDPLCAMCYLYPEIITKVAERETGICLDGLARGATMVDRWGEFKLGNKQRWIKAVNQELLAELLIKTIEEQN